MRPRCRLAASKCCNEEKRAAITGESDWQPQWMTADGNRVAGKGTSQLPASGLLQLLLAVAPFTVHSSLSIQQ